MILEPMSMSCDDQWKAEERSADSGISERTSKGEGTYTLAR